jgi:hypothetical protein
VTTWRFPVEAGHVTMFARSIGDSDPTHDHLEPEGPAVSAPPTFVIAAAQFQPGYPMRPTTGEKWFGSARDPGRARRVLGQGTEGGSGAPSGTGFHAEEHFEYLAPVRPGQVLTVSTDWGDTWQKHGSRGGLLTFTEKVTEFSDEDGAVLIRERSVYVRTEHTVAEQRGGE